MLLHNIFDCALFDLIANGFLPGHIEVIEYLPVLLLRAQHLLSSIKVAKDETACGSGSAIPPIPYVELGDVSMDDRSGCCCLSGIKAEIGRAHV